jgi:hypothetical protein
LFLTPSESLFLPSFFLVPGAAAKKARIASLRNHGAATQGTLLQQQQQSSLIIYIGDSSTDLSALLEADIGVMIGHSKSTIAICERWGIQLQPLSKRLERRLRLDDNNDVDKDDKHTIWVTTSWTEINWFLESLNHP